MYNDTIYSYEIRGRKSFFKIFLFFKVPSLDFLLGPVPIFFSVIRLYRPLVSTVLITVRGQYFFSVEFSSTFSVISVKFGRQKYSIPNFIRVVHFFSLPPLEGCIAFRIN